MNIVNIIIVLIVAAIVVFGSINYIKKLNNSCHCGIGGFRNRKLYQKAEKGWRLLP